MVRPAERRAAGPPLAAASARAHALGAGELVPPHPPGWDQTPARRPVGVRQLGEGVRVADSMARRCRDGCVWSGVCSCGVVCSWCKSPYDLLCKTLGSRASETLVSCTYSYALYSGTQSRTVVTSTGRYFVPHHARIHTEAREALFDRPSLPLLFLLLTLCLLDCFVWS